jgi:hypothetical protein
MTTATMLLEARGGSRARAVRAAAVRGRNSWVTYMRTTDADLRALFAEVSDSIADAIDEATVDGVLAIGNQRWLLDRIKGEFATLRPRLTAKIKAQMGQSLDLGLKAAILQAVEAASGTLRKATIGTSYVGKSGRVHRHDAQREALADSEWKRIHAAAMADLMRVIPNKTDLHECREGCSCRDLHEATAPADGLSLSARVWNLTAEAEKSITAAVNTGVVTGMSAYRIGRQVRRFLRDPQQSASGAPVRGDWTVAPGRGVYRSAYKNAQRLSRTENTRAFGEGVQRFAAERDWIVGNTWVAEDEACDACQEMDGKFFPKGANIPYPLHPHCFCYLELTTDEMRAAA